MSEFDAVVIGSGFGGAVAACRLAEAGYRVLVLERGRRWTVDQYPRKAGDAWAWDQDDPAKRNGWLDVRFFPHMAVVAGAGVGGGSLHFANTVITAQPELFEGGWPPEITFDELKPYYGRVEEMLKPRKVPEGQLSARAKLLKLAAERAGYGAQYRQVELAISFDEDYKYDSSQPPNPEHSKKFTNAEGLEQGTCVHLGNCVIGCDVKARNTLDLNYIPRAERHQAEVRPLHLVRAISREGSDYRVHFDRIAGKELVKGGSVTARIVVVSAGSLGSTELLLRSQREHKTLPGLSSRLGRNWSCNANHLTLAEHQGQALYPSRGVTIGAAVDFFGPKEHMGQRFIIEDGGVPDLGAAVFGRPRGGDPVHEFIRKLLATPRETMPWFSQGRDTPAGTFSLRKKILGVLGPLALHLDWDPKGAEKTIEAITDIHRKFAEVTGGKPQEALLWTLLRSTITPHPLGGCNMGTGPDNGVVDHAGEVFGYPNLFVSDGSIVPRAIGHNPSKTIAALGERIAAHIVQGGR